MGKAVKPEGFKVTKIESHDEEVMLRDLRLNPEEDFFIFTSKTSKD